MGVMSGRRGICGEHLSGICCDHRNASFLLQHFSSLLRIAELMLDHDDPIDARTNANLRHLESAFSALALRQSPPDRLETPPDA